MLRASLIAIVAVSLAACDDESETAVEETGSEVQVAVESAEQETTEAAAEAEETAEAATDEVTTLTSDSPAVETTVLFEGDSEEVVSSGTEGESASGGGTDPASGETSVGEESGDDMEMAAAETEAEPSASGGESDPLQRFQEWAQGRWAASPSCESGIVEMDENALSLPGGASCSEIEVTDAGADSLAIVGSSCEGAGDLEEVEIEVTQTDDGITVAHEGQEESLVRCQ